jgi:hypothetical protein
MTMDTPPASKGIALRDIIYFDSDRAASLASQFQEGLIREIQESSERAFESSDALGSRLGIVRSDSSSGTKRTHSRLESRIFHHDLLRTLEDSLFAAGVAQDFNASLDSDDAPTRIDALRERLDAQPYVRCEGWVYLEDFARLREITGKFNELIDMIAMAGGLPALLATEEGQQLEAAMHQLQLQLINLPDGKHKTKLTQDLVQLYVQRRTLLLGAAELDEMPEWLLDGIQLWINVFASDRISLRVYPAEETPDFQVVAHLKRDSFLDDLHQFRNLYGAEPNIKLTVFGLATSVPPPPSKPRFSPMEAFRAEAASIDSAAKATEIESGTPAGDTPSEEAIFEAAFRGMFPGAEGLERMIGFARYPAVTVAPVAVYRSVRTIDPPQKAKPRRLERLLHRG